MDGSLFPSLFGFFVVVVVVVVVCVLFLRLVVKAAGRLKMNIELLMSVHLLASYHLYGVVVGFFSTEDVNDKRQ